jgi:hypothetical protein
MPSAPALGNDRNTFEVIAIMELIMLALLAKARVEQRCRPRRDEAVAKRRDCH